MAISRKVTNGFAWAGLVLVVGVLSADFVSSRFASDEPSVGVAEAVTPAVFPLPASARPKPVQQVAIVSKPAAPVKSVPVVAKPVDVAATGVVRDYLDSGKALPSYITDAADKPVAVTRPTTAPAAVEPTVAVAPAAVVPVAEPSDPIQVGSIDAMEPVSMAVPHKIAPMPLPLSLRPKPVAPLIVDEASVGTIVKPRINQAPTRNDFIAVPASNDIVDEQDLRDWESGPLSDFLASRRNAEPSRAMVRRYDADGFFLDDGPSQQGDHVIGPVDDGTFYPFDN